MKLIGWIDDNQWVVPPLLGLIGTIVVLNVFGQWVSTHTMWWVKGTGALFVAMIMVMAIGMGSCGTSVGPYFLSYPKNEKAERRMGILFLTISTSFLLFFFTLVSIGVQALWNLLF